jgi:hypothetical protein
MFKGQFVVFVGIFEVSSLMMLFGSFHEIRIVPSEPCRITLGKTLILRLLELFDGGCIFSCNSNN